MKRGPDSASSEVDRLIVILAEGCYRGKLGLSANILISTCNLEAAKNECSPAGRWTCHSPEYDASERPCLQASDPSVVWSKSACLPFSLRRSSVVRLPSPQSSFQNLVGLLPPQLHQLGRAKLEHAAECPVNMLSVMGNKEYLNNNDLAPSSKR